MRVIIIDIVARATLPHAYQLSCRDTPRTIRYATYYATPWRHYCFIYAAVFRRHDDAIDAFRCRLLFAFSQPHTLRHTQYALRYAAILRFFMPPRYASRHLLILRHA